jgi:hypothetical protein
MGAGEADSRLVYSQSYSDSAFVSELTAHPRLYSILLNTFNGVLPAIADESDLHESHHFDTLDKNLFVLALVEELFEVFDPSTGYFALFFIAAHDVVGAELNHLLNSKYDQVSPLTHVNNS